MKTEPSRIGTASPDLFADYSPTAGGFDEMIDAQGVIRPHWQPLVNHFGSRTSADQAADAEKLRRMVRENGIAEDLFAETGANTDPWKIDIIPLMLPPAEWQWMAAAVIQRARLFDKLLDDLYGEQKLLASGVLPPHLVLSDPAFLRPLRGTERGSGRLTFYAVDMARGPDGLWRVIDSHAETTAGSGFALANRVVHSRVMSALFNECKVRRLSPFFQGVQGELLARAGRDDAAIALLTPGPHHEDYFGHAYLARYLSMLLVEGGDLRVVGNRVYVKTLEGLQPLDLIVRTVEAFRADPLQLDPGGYLGPAGLVQALRRNPNLTANALGTAIIENRGLAPYLATLCQQVLGEELAVWDIPRWWLGEPKVRQHVLANLDSMTIRPVQEGTGRPGRGGIGGIVPARLKPEEMAMLRDEIAMHGHGYIAEEKISCATVPSWTPEGLRPQPYAVRLYAALIGGEFRVMPGGIAFDIAPERGVALYSPDGHSRDVWVMTDGAGAPYVSTLRQTLEMPAISRGGTGLRSRIADNIFWLGRYAERADWTMRLLRAAISRLTPDSAGFPHREVVSAALHVLLNKDNGIIPMSAITDSIEPLTRALLSGRGRSYGVIYTLDQLRHIASLIRDRLSVELWRSLRVFHTSPIWRGEREPASIAEALDTLDEGIVTLAAFNGLAAENMTRSHGWSFLDIGRRLERAFNLSEMLFALFAEVREEAAESAALTLALEVADSTLTYRSRYLFAPALPLVIDLLLADETNPRSVVFQLEAISKHFEALPKMAEPLPQSEKRKVTLDLLTRVKLADVFKLSQVEPSASRDSLKALLTQLTTDLPKLSEAISRRYFSLTEDEMKRVNPRFGPRS